MKRLSWSVPCCAMLFLALMVAVFATSAPLPLALASEEATETTEKSEPEPEYSSLTELKDLRFCETVGGQLNLTVEDVLGKQNFAFYPDLSSCLQAVANNKADVFMADEPVARQFMPVLSGELVGLLKNT
ncbi:MAG: hypothetical protein Q4B54_08380, partial [Coriobacteriales bacterium]|nr:hypothetical protein [Coriobacteriales bacterium]